MKNIEIFLEIFKEILIKFENDKMTHVLCCAVLCCAVLCCAVLCCAVEDKTHTQP
jgi:hypothetical protein